MYLSEVATELAEMFCLHDHVPQVIVVVAGSDNLGIFSKAQIRARAQDMVNDMLVVWDKVCPEPQLCLGLFISLLLLHLWYTGYHQQWAGREARRSLNSTLGKIAKALGAIVVPHHIITSEEQWFNDPRCNPTRLSEPGYDIMLQNIGLALTPFLQMSPYPEQRRVAVEFFHAQSVQKPASPTKVSSSTRIRHSRKHKLKWRALWLCSRLFFIDCKCYLY